MITASNRNHITGLIYITYKEKLVISLYTAMVIVRSYFGRSQLIIPLNKVINK